MKELSIEEKAKRYDEAIKKAKTLYQASEYMSGCDVIIKTIFPELKESEDERIRKALIDGFTVMKESKNCGKTFSNYNIPVVDILAWLERQGEQKPIDKIKPKFNVGDWIVTPANKVFQITSIEGTSYKFDNESHYWEICYCDEQYRLWTIQDAKAGDVIYSRHNTESFEWIGIFKSLDKENKGVHFYGFWNNVTKTFKVCGNELFVSYDDFSPATKEQRDLLFAKMKEAGYEWDANKKELKKIEHSEWSKEDECMINNIIDTLKPLSQTTHSGYAINSMINWLKSLKEKYTWKSSEEQLKVLNEVLNFAANHECLHWNDYIFGTLNNLIRQLKKLKG